MKTLLWCFSLCLFLLLPGCAKDPELAKMKEFYNKFDAHCRAHARSMLAEYDEQVRYDECMTYFTNIDPNCPMETIEPYMNTSGN